MRTSHISEETRLQASSVPHVTGDVSVQPRSQGRREDWIYSCCFSVR